MKIRQGGEIPAPGQAEGPSGEAFLDPPVLGKKGPASRTKHDDELPTLHGVLAALDRAVDAGLGDLDMAAVARTSQD